MCRTVIVLSLIGWLSFVANAGMIKGIALENLTGLPLARTRLTLVRLEGDRLKPVAKDVVVYTAACADLTAAADEWLRAKGRPDLTERALSFLA